MDFWDPKNECLSRDEIEQLQLERLQATLHRVYKNVRHYRKVLTDIDFMPEDLLAVADLTKLPFTRRSDLTDNYPYGMFAVPLREVVRLHAPAISLENPVVMGFTRNDLHIWAELMARNLRAVGVTKDDVVQVALNFGLMTGPYGVQLGAELLGASVIPMSSGKLPSQVKVMRDFRTTTLISTPTFALSLAHTMQSMGIDPHSLALKFGILGAEPWSEATRRKIEEAFRITATDAYALTEIFGPGVAWECPAKDGLHVPEDHFLPEIIDPASLTPAPPGTEGELVITTLSKEAFPLIRFRTGDLARITYAPCACGRTHARISRIFKRSDAIFVMRGTSVVPDQVAKVLERVIQGRTNYQLVIEQTGDQDLLFVQVEISDDIFFDEMKRQRRFVEKLHQALSEFLGWEVGVKLVEPGTFDPQTRVVDKRVF